MTRQPVWDEEEGRVVRFYGVTKDITERKQAEEALRASEEHYRSLIQKVQTAIVLHDGQGRIVTSNPLAQNLLGLSEDQLLGKTLDEPDWHFLREDGSVMPVSEYPASLVLSSGQRFSSYVVGIDRPDDPVWALVNAEPEYADTGEMVRIIVSFVDITEKRRAENERLVNLRFFESMDKVNWIIQGTNDLEKMLNDLLDFVLGLFDSDRAFLMFPCDPEASSWRVPFEQTRPEYPGAAALGEEIPMGSDVAQTLRILLAADGPVKFGPETEYPLPPEVSHRFGFQAFMSMALFPKVGPPWQFGVHQCSYPRVWTSEEERLFREIGRRMSNALTSLLAYRNLQESERELRKANDLLQTIIEAAPTAIIGLDLDGNVHTVWNPAAERMLGWSAQEVMGKPLPSVPAESQEEFSHFREQIRGGLTLDGVEVRRQRKDGSPIDYSIYASPLRDAAGHITGNIAVLVDISERKAAEENLQRYLRRLATLRDIDRHILVAASPKEITNVVLEHLVQLIPCEWASIVLYNDAITEERVIAWRHAPDIRVPVEKSHPVVPNQVLERLKTGQSAVTGDLRLQEGPRAQLADGLLTQGARSAMANPLIAQGRLIGVLALASTQVNFFTPEHQQIAEEIATQVAIALRQAELNDQVQRHSAELEQRVAARTTELADAKQQIETILHNIADAVVFTDVDANIMYVNPAWERLTGYTLVDATGQNPSILKSGQTALSTYEAMWDSILAGRTWRGVLLNKRKDGTLYDAELTIAPVNHEQGVVRGFVGVQRDVTKERQLAAMKEQFIADAAHDLGNPVSALQVSLYLLKKDPSQLPRRLASFEHGVNRLSVLVKELLTISRLDRRTLAPVLKPIDLNTIVAPVVESQRLLAAEKKQTLVREPSPGLPPVLGDSDQIERVVVNLIANAINYTPEGGGISVSIHQEKDRVVLVVSDTGIGIAPEEQHHIFDRFYRTSRAKTTSEGTGLGLAIVKEIIDLHGGEIAVKSEVGQGSTFTVSLPAANLE